MILSVGISNNHPHPHLTIPAIQSYNHMLIKNNVQLSIHERKGSLSHIVDEETVQAGDGHSVRGGVESSSQGFSVVVYVRKGLDLG